MGFFVFSFLFLPAQPLWPVAGFLFLGFDMSEYILERFCDSEDMGVFGRLLKNGVQIAYTCEQTWRDNQPFVSCVPAGRYDLAAYQSQKYGKTYALHNPAIGVGVHEGEAQRYACLIHSANLGAELRGCIALGSGIGCVNGFWAIINSARTTQDFLRQIKPTDTLTIIWKDHP